jgi:hypothetical protein
MLQMPYVFKLAEYGRSMARPYRGDVSNADELKV